MAKREATLVVRLRDRATSGLRRFRQSLGKITKVAGLVAAALGAITTIVGAKFLTGAIRSAGQFDEAMSAVGAVTGATAEELERLRTTADEAAATTRFTAQEAAGGLEELSRAGFNATQSIAALNPVLNLAAGNNQSVAESAIQVTTALNAFGLEAKQAGRVADVYTRAAQRSAQTTEQLGQAMSFAAPVARQAGLSIEQTAALVGRLADAGFRGSRGGTALRNALSQLQDPTSSFSKALNDAGIQSRNFVEVIEQLAQGGEKADAAIRALGLEAAPAIQSLVAGGVPALQKLTAELENASGATKEAAETMEDNLPGALRSFASAFDQARRRLVAPLVERIKEEVQDLTDRLRRFTASGTIEKFSELLVNAFDAAVKVVKEFVSKIDFEEIGRKITEFATNAAARLKQFATDALAVRRSVRQLTGAIQLFAGSLVTAFNAAATAIAATLAFLNRQVERQLKALQRFTFGLNPIVNRALKEVQSVQEDLETATTDFATRMVAATEMIAAGYANLTAEVEESAKDQTTAQEEAAEAAEETGRRIGATAAELEEFRERAARNLEIVRGWDRQVEQAGQSAQQTGQQVQQLGQSAERTGDQIDEAGDQAEEAGEQQAEAADKALTAWLDFGNGLEAVTFQLKELAGTATSLEQLREQAEAATPPVIRLEEAIQAASDTTDLDRIIATMARLREEGLLTEAQYSDLTAAVFDQAEAFREATRETEEQTESLRGLADQAIDTAAGLDQVGEAARGAGRQAKSSAQGFGAVLDSWRELGPEANAEVDKFIEQMNAFPQMSFSVARGRLARFTRFMEDRFGSLRDATREANQEIDKLDRQRGDSSQGSRTIDVNFNVTRDPQGPLALREEDFNAIVNRVVAAIRADQERTGA